MNQSCSALKISETSTPLSLCACGLLVLEYLVLSFFLFIFIQYFCNKLVEKKEGSKLRTERHKKNKDVKVTYVPTGERIEQHEISCFISASTKVSSHETEECCEGIINPVSSISSNQLSSLFQNSSFQCFILDTVGTATLFLHYLFLEVLGSLETSESKN